LTFAMFERIIKQIQVIHDMGVIMGVR
jgi:hypothetical protein